MERFLRGLGVYALVFPIAGMAVLTFLSSLPGEEHSDALLFYGVSINMSPKIQNLIHIPAFFVLGTLWMLAFEIMAIPSASAIFWTMGLGIAFGVLDEIHQYYVPYRYPGLLDATSDALGIILACISWRFLRPLLFAIHSESPTEGILSSKSP